MRKKDFLNAAAVFLVAFAGPASAYVGPGIGLSAIGSLLALIAAVVVAIVGFLWFPIKRLLKKRKTDPQTIESATGEISEDATK
jgi:hypothetical protein